MTKLQFKGITEIVGNPRHALIILTNDDESRCITVLCDKRTEQEFAIRMANNTKPIRFLPEVLCDIISSQTTLQLEINIFDIVAEQYRAFIHNTTTGLLTRLNITEAILLSYIGDLPILIDDQLWDRQSVIYHEGSTGLSLPINVLTNDMLQVALKNAIATENYELASQLRDEENRRKRSCNKP